MRINSLKILIPQNATKFKRMFSAPSPSHFDLVIVGAGMAGSSLACSLAAQNQLSICLVDSIPAKPIPSPLPAIPDLRVFSLNQQSITFLQEIGAWDTIYHTHRNSPYYDIIVWDSQNNASLLFSYLDSNYDCIGNIVEQNIIQGALYQVLQNQPNVQFMCPTKVQSVHLPKNSSEYAQINFDGGKSITANLVVGGDGANSFIREASGITFKQKDYNQKAIVCSLELDRPHEHTAYQRFLPSGPVALLPLYEDHLASIVWTTSLFQFEQLQKLSDEDFIVQWQNAFNERMNSFSLPETIATEGTKLFNSILNRNNVSVPTVPKINRLVGKRAGFPLKLGHAMQYVTPRMALIGDACHVCHPLAGLGINIGFGDVIALRNTINNAIFSGSDIGDILALRQYESERKATNLATIMGIDALSNIFTSTNPLLTLGRGIGISAIDQLAPLKRLFQDRAGTASIHNNS